MYNLKKINTTVFVIILILIYFIMGAFLINNETQSMYEHYMSNLSSKPIDAAHDVMKRFWTLFLFSSLAMLLIFIFLYYKNKKEVKKRQEIEINLLKQTQAAEEHTRALVEAAPFACELWKDSSTIIFANKASLDLYGIESLDEYLENIGKFQTEYHEDESKTHEHVSEFIYQTLETGKTIHCEWILIHAKTGANIPTNIVFKRIKYGDGYVVAAYIRDLRDVNALINEAKEREKAEGKLKANLLLFDQARKAEEQARLLVETSPLACTLWKSPSELVYANESAYTQSGFQTMEDYIQNFFRYFTNNFVGGEKIAENMVEILNSTFANGDYPDVEFELVKHGTEEHIPVLVYIKRIKVNNDFWVVVYFQDMRETYTRLAEVEKIKQMEVELAEQTKKAEKDSLSGLYNKATTEHLIIESLDRRKAGNLHSALIMIDVDNFKDVNDKLGHLYGDVVLTQLADDLNGMFRDDDIVGRIGGDEFFVFIRDYKEKDLVIKKAKQICKTFHKAFTRNSVVVHISASVGIALFPEHGDEFEMLYKNADAALYTSKANGKNQYTIYDSENTIAYESTRTKIDTQLDAKSFRENRVEYIFKLLYGSPDPMSSIQSVLQLITEHFGFSRGYIFENSEDGKRTSNTFEWCADGVTAEIDNLQELPIDIISISMKSFNDTGMYILKDVTNLPTEEREVLEAQGIKSMFQFGIKENEQCLGFIGFDDCEKARVPSNEEIDNICTICHILSMFFLTHRKEKKGKQILKSMHMIIDNLENYTYVIDPKNHEILYENKNAKKTIGVSSVGKKCYAAYRGCDSPCMDCPIIALENEEKNVIKHIENNILNSNFRVSPTWIEWIDGRRVCLINSVQEGELI